MTGPVTSIIGEIHLHQFPSGGHAWAEFLDTALPVSDVRGDSITEVDTAPTMADGPCTL